MPGERFGWSKILNKYWELKDKSQPRGCGGRLGKPSPAKKDTQPPPGSEAAMLLEVRPSDREAGALCLRLQVHIHSSYWGECSDINFSRRKRIFTQTDLHDSSVELDKTERPVSHLTS